jgi:hypothetical protein
MASVLETFNSASGSDSQASGSGGTAVFGVHAATNGSTTVDITAEYTLVSGETPSGTIDGSNVTFGLANAPVMKVLATLITKNGTPLTYTTDYTISGTVLTFVVAPAAAVQASYVLDGSSATTGTYDVTNATPAGGTTVPLIPIGGTTNPAAVQAIYDGVLGGGYVTVTNVGAVNDKWLITVNGAPGQAVFGTNPAIINNTTDGTPTVGSFINGNILDVLLASYLYGGPDVTNINANGSAVLWVLTSSGRQFDVITVVTVGYNIVTFTVLTGYTTTQSSLTWASGGKRATVDDVNSRHIFADALPAWTLKEETSETLTSALALSATGSLAGGQIILDLNGTTLSAAANANAFTITGDYWLIKNGTLVMLGSAYGINTGNHTNVVGLTISGSGTGINQTGGVLNLLATTITCAGTYNINAAGIGLYVDSCQLKGASSFSIQEALTGGAIIIENSTIVVASGAYGIQLLHSGFIPVTIKNNTLYGNNAADSGIYVASIGMVLGLVLVNNIIDNWATGVNLPSDATFFVTFWDYNDYYANGTDISGGTPGGAHDLALDPQFVNAAGGNFAIGTNLKGKGWSPYIGAGMAPTASSVDMGASQAAASGGGGGGFIIGG